MARRPIKWVICYINSKMMKTLDKDLSKHPKYRLVRAYIPIVRILKKQFKGKDFFDEIPLLFNYGFFEVPEYFISNPHFLDMMKKDIECIYAWVKDPANKLQVNSILTGKHNPRAIALATAEDIKNLIMEQESKSIYSAKDIKNLKVGKTITLMGYPFEGLQAEVISVDLQKKEVEVRLLLDTFMKKVTVSFDNIFYTIYKSDFLNTEMKEQSLDDMKNIDNLFTKIQL